MNFFVFWYNSTSGKYEQIVGPETNPRLSFEADSVDDAAGLAAIQDRKQGKFLTFNLDDATLTNTSTQLTAASENLTLTDL